MGNWIHNEITDAELKKLVSNVYDGSVFTSLQCRNNAMSSFMVLMFLGTPPIFPTLTGDIKKDRKNKLNHITDKEIYEQETPQREAYINNIGMCYEFMSKAGPSSINGMPIFYSCKLLSKEDTKKFIDMYNKYVKMREDFEKDWTTDEK